MNIRRKYHYSDIYLVPKKTIVDSRSDCDTSVKFGDHIFLSPVLAANMRSIVDYNTSLFFASKKMFYIMHRFDVDQVDFIDFMQSKGHIASISVGVNEDSYSQLRKIKEADLSPEYITIDIANIFSNKGESMVKYLKDNFTESFIIAGNLATGEAALEVAKWGANSIKCGIGNGLACRTKNKTGFSIGSASTVYDVCSALNYHQIDIPVIADGGIREHGDIAKAIALGADMVMAGSLFAGYDQSAGNIIEIDGRKYKEYYGSASEFNKKEKKHIEGKKILVDYKGDMSYAIEEIAEDLRSSVSYSGGKNLSGLRSVEIIAEN